jgi:prepilin peptidase CpaA
MLEAIVAVAFPMLAIYAGCTDFLAKIIPNRVSLLAVAFYFVAALGLGMPLQMLGWSMLGAAIVFCLGLIPFSLNVMGAGDVKFATVAVLWLGVGQILPFLFFLSLYGLAMILIMVFFHRELSNIRAPNVAFFDEIQTRLPLPYGIPMAIAALQLYPASPIVRLAF